MSAVHFGLLVHVAASFLPTPTTILPHASPLRTAAITAIEKKETAIDVADAQTLLASFLADGGSVVDGAESVLFRTQLQWGQGRQVPRVRDRQHGDVRPPTRATEKRRAREPLSRRQRKR